MMKYLVSIDGAPPQETLVQPRTGTVVPGVLCEVAINGKIELCVVDRVGALTLDVRRLPNPNEAPVAKPLSAGRGVQ